MSYTALISAEELAQSLGTDDCLIFDCRFDLADAGKGRRQYLESHIPGAFYAHLDDDLSGPVTPASGRHPLPDPVKLCGWLGQRGMSSGQQVVVYDDSGAAMAVRLWWLLKMLGHDRVAVLDGGWSAWQRLNLPTDSEIPQKQSRHFEGIFDLGQVVSTARLVENLETQELQLVDVRTAPRFNGEQEPIDPVAGHIPGAINLPLTENLTADTCFKPAQMLRDLYAPLLEMHSIDQQVYMCGSGVTACHSLLALVIAGYPMPRLYAGSWSEWIRDSGRPVATGAG